MEISLKEALLIYAERFPDGHPLKDIALTTLTELGRTNPFGINTNTREHYTPGGVVDLKYNAYYDNIGDACNALGERGASARRNLQLVLRKYNLKLI